MYSLAQYNADVLAASNNVFMLMEDCQILCEASVIGVVVSSLALHRGDLGSIPGFSIQAVQIHA